MGCNIARIRHGVPMSHRPVWRCPTCLEMALLKRSLPCWGGAGCRIPSLTPVKCPGLQHSVCRVDARSPQAVCSLRERWSGAANQHCFNGKIREQGKPARMADNTAPTDSQAWCNMSGCASAKPCQCWHSFPMRPRPNVGRQHVFPLLCSGAVSMSQPRWRLYREL